MKLLAPTLCVLLFSACSHKASGPPGGGDEGDGGTDGSSSSSSSGDLAGTGFDTMPTSIKVTPNPATASVSVQNGAVTTTPVAFTAVDENGTPVAVSWTIDRGELGALTSAGVFTANGLNGGTAHVTATVGVVSATVPLAVTMSQINVGANAGSGTGPQGPNDMGVGPTGGYNGVGGVPLGGAPADTTVTLLQNGTGTNAAFTMLYPYDQTVFPQGMLAPLLQWAVPSGFDATAISVHLKEVGYEFYGYYAGTQLVNAPIDAAAWTTATADNSGDPLLVEVKVTDGTNVLGPLSIHFVISPSRLRGTVYYNTYDSKLSGGTANGSDGNGAVLRIDPGSPAPTLAIPANANQCYACHEVSTDGSTLFTATNDTNDNPGAVFNLKDPMQAGIPYTNNNTPKTGGMFTYGGIYPDGTMGLASSNENYHAWDENSDVFSATTLASVGTTGFTDVVTQAVTPSFSPDGTHAAFAFWAGAGSTGVQPSEQTLAIMDFSCGAVPGSVACAAGGPYAFSGLRTLYTDTTSTSMIPHYVGWPSFTPDSQMVVFQHSFIGSSDGGSVLNTRSGAQAEIWIADVPDPSTGATSFSPQGLCALNGYASDCTTPYLPEDASTSHTVDQQLNFEPNVTPISSGGYYWVVFTSRRLYGNVATTSPYFPVQGGAAATTPPTKKLWMAAIDPNPKTGTDPSHPAFYLPGQEIMSGNMRAYWVNEPCQNNGVSCQTGDQCCSGYCTDDGAGALECGMKPAGCVTEYNKCTTTADCCGTGQLSCIDGLCSLAPIE